MSRKFRMILALGALALAALTSSAASASATTWTSNGSAGGTGFTLTAPTSKFQTSGVGAGWLCTGTSASGKLYGPSGPLTSPVAGLTLRFTGCSAAGWSFVYTCATDGTEFDAVSYAAPVVTGVLKAATFPICTMTVPSMPGCTVNYSPTNGIGTTWADATYDNSRGTLTLSSTGQQLTASWTGCPLLFGTANGSAATTLGSNSTPPGNLAFTVTSAFVPNITI